MTGRAICGGGKPCVSTTSPTPSCNDEPLAIKEKVLQYFSPLIISNKRADRNPNDEILSVPSCLVFTFTVGPFLGKKLFGVG
jgi:hypothetical protein